MITAELLRWAAVAAIAAAVTRFPPLSGFWSLTAGRPFVVARAAAHPARFRGAVPA